MNKKSILSTGSIVMLMSISLADVITLKSNAHMTVGCEYHMKKKEYDEWGKCVKAMGIPSCDKAWQSPNYSGPCYRGLSDGRVIQTEIVRDGKAHLAPFIHHAITESNCRGARYSMIRDHILNNYFKAHYRRKKMPLARPYYGATYKPQRINSRAWADWADTCLKEAAKCQWKPYPPKGNGWVRLGFYGTVSADSCMDTYVRNLSKRGNQIEIQTQVTIRKGKQKSPDVAETMFIRCNTWEQLRPYSENWRPIPSNTIGSDAAKMFC